MNAAYTAASGTTPGALAALLVAAACALAFFVLAHLLLGLWDEHQGGQLMGGDAASYAVRGTLAIFLLVFLLL